MVFRQGPLSKYAGDATSASYQIWLPVAGLLPRSPHTVFSTCHPRLVRLPTVSNIDPPRIVALDEKSTVQWLLPLHGLPGGLGQRELKTGYAVSYPRLLL